MVRNIETGVPRLFRRWVGQPNQTFETLYRHSAPAADTTVNFTQEEMTGKGYKILSFSITARGSFSPATTINCLVNGTSIRTYNTSTTSNEVYVWYFKVRNSNDAHAIRILAGGPTMEYIIIEARLEHGG